MKCKQKLNLNQWDYGILGVITAHPGFTKRQIYNKVKKEFVYFPEGCKNTIKKLLDTGEIFGERWGNSHLYHYYVKALY